VHEVVKAARELSTPAGNDGRRVMEFVGVEHPAGNGGSWAPRLGRRPQRAWDRVTFVSIFFRKEKTVTVQQ
jgi:hypothetical protein